MLGKMNEHSWSLKDGKDATLNQCNRNKKSKCHLFYPRVQRWNKKKGRSELSSKNSRLFRLVRVTD